MNNGSKIRFCVKASMCCVIYVLCAMISIPTVPPFTLQSLGIFAVTGIFGTAVGMTAYLLYLIMGAVGLPVFAGFSGGFAVLFGPTGGYLIGFLFAVAVMGSTVKILGKGCAVLVLAYSAGLITLYLSATVFYAVVWLHSFNFSALVTAVSVCVVPFIPADAAKLAVSVYITRRLDGRMRL